MAEFECSYSRLERLLACTLLLACSSARLLVCSPARLLAACPPAPLLNAWLVLPSLQNVCLEAALRCADCSVCVV